jgi:hypothetical protein
MDCLRSGLDGAELEVAVVLDGLAGGLACGPPKKSSPNKESAGLLCFGGAVSAFGGGSLSPGGPVLGRAGAAAGSSPNKSIAGPGLGAARGGGTVPAEAAAFCEADLSNFAFSWTTFNGYDS